MVKPIFRDPDKVSLSPEKKDREKNFRGFVKVAMGRTVDNFVH